MTEFNNVTEGLHKELSFSNNEYKKWLGNLDNEVIDKSKKIKFRKSTATVLKLIVIVSGIVIASGFLEDYEIIIQIIGVVVLLITAIEQVYGNIDILLSYVAAKHAYSRIRREVVKLHTINLGPILRLKASDENKAAEQLIELQSGLIVKLVEIDDEIRTNLENKQYELLERLTLEEGDK